MLVFLCVCVCVHARECARLCAVRVCVRRVCVAVGRGRQILPGLTPLPNSKTENEKERERHKEKGGGEKKKEGVSEGE